MSALHATQCESVPLQTMRISEQSRSDVQAAGRLTHALSAHCCAAGQSRSVSQSTQNPRRVEHTCRGHITDDPQRVTLRQAWPRQTRDPVQSDGALQPTHWP